MIKIQASIRGFSSKACTVFAVYDEASKFLVLNKESDYREDRFNECVVISNADLPDRDVLFEKEHINDAIHSFFELVNSGLLEVSDKASRCNPTNVIERDGINENGKALYRISDTISNGQIAALAIAGYVNQATLIKTTLDFQERIFDLMSAEILSI